MVKAPSRRSSLVTLLPSLAVVNLHSHSVPTRRHGPGLPDQRYTAMLPRPACTSFMPVPRRPRLRTTDRSQP